MRFVYDIPEGVWGLFRSVNRDTYMEALLRINEEYEYNNYFMSRETCIQVLSEFFSESHLLMGLEEDETELDVLELPAIRVLNWLIRRGWLKTLEDYSTLTTNILIPDYTAIFLDAFDRLTKEEVDDTQVYIQNIYATLFSFKHDKRSNVSLLKTALINTKKLNKVLQDMLHNMDRFFNALLEKNVYTDVLKEHLEGYVEEVVHKKYHILKTSDNFYMFKNEIKELLNQMRDQFLKSEAVEGNQSYSCTELLTMIDDIERGFFDIEHRISNMDREHSKYVKATVMRLHYLLEEDSSNQGQVLKLVNAIANHTDVEESLRKVGSAMNLAELQVMSSGLFYKRRKSNQEYMEKVVEDRIEAELSESEVLRLNKIQQRYHKRQIEEFIEESLSKEMGILTQQSVTKQEDFEKLILAYDYCYRKESNYTVRIVGEHNIENGEYSYPQLMFQKRLK